MDGTVVYVEVVVVPTTGVAEVVIEVLTDRVFILANLSKGLTLTVLAL